MNKYKLVVFDWDGTLMDSISRIVSSMQAAAKSCQLDIPTEKQTKAIIGLGLFEAVTILFPSCTDEQAHEIISQYKLQYGELNNTPAPMFDGVHALLEQLKSQGRLLAVATGKARPGLNKVIEISQTASFWDLTMSVDEANSKPDPQMLELLLAEFNLAPHQAIMIGDSKHDLKMAQNAGVDSIGITLGVDNKQELLKYQPKTIFDSIESLSELFT